MTQKRYDLSAYEYLGDPDILETTPVPPLIDTVVFGRRQTTSTDYNNLAPPFPSPDLYTCPDNTPMETSTSADRFDFVFRNIFGASYNDDVFRANIQGVQQEAYSHGFPLTQGHEISNSAAIAGNTLSPQAVIMPDSSWYPAQSDKVEERNNVDPAEKLSRGPPDKRQRLSRKSPIASEQSEETLQDPDGPAKPGTITPTAAAVSGTEVLSKLRTSSRTVEKKTYLRPDETPGEHKSRTSHNIVEKQYRNRLHKKFEALIEVLPPGMRQGDDGDGSDGSNRPVSKAEVLTFARRYILELRRERDTAEGERHAMVDTVEMLNSRLRSRLRNEGDGKLDGACTQ